MNLSDSRLQTETAVFSLIEQGLDRLGTAFNEDRIQKLTDLVFLLSHWAQRINLTGHRDPLELAARLVLDAAALATAVPELNSRSSLADLGSGAGFPGLPIAILYPHLKVHLVDSRLKRSHFQRAARRHLRLPNVHPLLGRSDEIDTVPCDVVVAQAMTEPEKAFDLMIPWAEPGGLVLLPASERATEPRISAQIQAFERRLYQVPTTKIRRILWVAWLGSV